MTWLETKPVAAMTLLVVHPLRRICGNSLRSAGTSLAHATVVASIKSAAVRTDKQLNLQDVREISHSYLALPFCTTIVALVDIQSNAKLSISLLLALAAGLLLPGSRQ